MFITIKRSLGFTLIELSIVLVILAVLTSGIVAGVTTYIERARFARAYADLNIIKETLIGFAIINGRLPCPDTNNDGLEDGAIGAGFNCGNNAVGGLPYATLGVDSNTSRNGRDIWGQPLIYRVTLLFADDPNNADDNAAGCVSPPLSGASIWSCSDGDITVQDPLGGTIADIPVIIVSTGANLGNDPSPSNPQSVNEAENIDNDATFVNTTFSLSSGNEFDDIVVWISPNYLKNRLLAMGKLP